MFRILEMLTKIYLSDVGDWWIGDYCLIIVGLELGHGEREREMGLRTKD